MSSTCWADVCSSTVNEITQSDLIRNVRSVVCQQALGSEPNCFLAPARTDRIQAPRLRERIDGQRILDERPAMGGVEIAHSNGPARRETAAQPGSDQWHHPRFEGWLPLARLSGSVWPAHHD